MVANGRILGMLAELARLTLIEEGNPNAFKVRAYENAIHGIEATPSDVAAMSESELTKIKGVGGSIAQKIREFVDTGTVVKLDQLRSKYPPGLVELLRIPGLGPKTLLMIRQQLGIENLDDLRTAIEAHHLRDLPGLGKTTEEKIAKAIERLGLHGKDRRTPIADALPLAEALASEIRELTGVRAAQYCGSLRRFAETIGDIDIVVATTEAAPVMSFVAAHPTATEVIGHGETKTSILTRYGLQVDVRAVTTEQFGAATIYFTGSKAHNIALRQRAIDRGWLLSEYGLFEGDRVVASAREEDVYAALGLEYIEPTLRENGGEIEAAAHGELPDLVRLEDVKGDLHYHCDRSGDGRSSLEEMVAAAAARGYQYLAITDHGEDLAINGSSREQMLAHQKAIGRLQEKYPKMRLLFGCELNIGSDGGLDYDPEFRLQFDWCVASIHSQFDLPPSRQTERLLKAIGDPAVSVIGHLTGRYIGRRPGVELEVDAVLEGLAATGVGLEVNGALDRLDASSEVIHRAVAAGVNLVISTDSHHTSDLRRMHYGVLNAQRGWAPKTAVANTWPAKKFLAWAKKRRH